MIREKFFNFWNDSKLVKQLDSFTRKVNSFLKTNNVPFHIWPFDWWPVILEQEPIFVKFNKKEKDTYNPNRWGGRFLVIKIGSRG
jgi:hypothetical protein